MKAYKGFDKNLKCREFQFKVGGEYEEERAELCECGFHACEAPLDVLNYYPPATSRYCVVELEDVTDERGDDSKRVGRKIKIGEEIGIEGLVEAHIEYVKGQTVEATNSTGYRGVSTSTGDGAVSTSTGNRAVSTSTGDGAVSTSTGDGAVSTSTGYRAVSTVSGADSVAVATGKYGRVKGSVGCAVVCIERGEYNGKSCPILAIKADIVDGRKLKPDTWYTVKNGGWVEAEDD